MEALGITVERLEKYTHGRPDSQIYAIRADIVRSAFDSESEDEDAAPMAASSVRDPDERREEIYVEETTSLMSAAIRQNLRAEYDKIEIDELVLDTVGVVIPTGSGVWIPVVRKDAPKDRNVPVDLWESGR